ncbi:MAG: inorganic diphosphatase [Nitrosomonadales bacterium]|nr:inorganic diphosphatase [Nitrosomonadales bacterium]
MSLNLVSAGKNLPNECNVIIEIPANSDPVKYEVDKESGALFVDRFVSTLMRYPCNYGYIPNTLADDGDPVDVLVITPFPLVHGAVIRVRPLGMLDMDDESGGDAKLVAVPVTKLTPLYQNVNSIDDLPEQLLQQIQHFFENYKSLEKGKWVKVKGWKGIEAAQTEITNGVANYKG